ncbi:MAG: hypothetical protein AB1393_11030 [Candidatus Edwardsbacteria bacterium]
MELFKRLGTIDRRIIYLLVALVVIIPLLLRLVLPIRISEPVRRAYEAVDRLPPGAVVIVSIDYDAASEPELQPQLLAMLRHCFSKDLKVILTGHWALGLPLGEIGLNQIAREFKEKKYGIDYVNLGYRPGYRALMVGIGREIRDFFATDYRGVSLDSLPLTRPIHNYNDIDLLISLSAGQAGDEWIQFAGARYGLKIMIGSTGVVAPDMFHYLQAEQIEGIVGGLQGAAEYETLVKHAGTATRGMTAQSTAHILIILFIVLGNIGYFVMRRRK